MLNADSSTLKSDSDVHSRNAPPSPASAAALSCTVRTSPTMSSIGASGNVRLISVTTKLDSFARPPRPRTPSVRNVSGTNESSAKYATIAARCVPRSAKNFANSARFRTRTRAVSFGPVDAAQALAELREISSQIDVAVILDEQGAVVGSTHG